MTNWNKRFIELAKHVSTWSHDPSTKVGAVIVNENRVVVGMGYNGFPRGVQDSPERLNNKELKRELVVHAELNAILNSNGSVKGCDLYVYPYPPCNECAKAIIQSGIKRVFCIDFVVTKKWADAFEISEIMFKEAGVEVKFIDFAFGDSLTNEKAG